MKYIVILILLSICWMPSAKGKKPTLNQPITLKKAKTIKPKYLLVSGDLSDLIFWLRSRSYELDKDKEEGFRGLAIVTQHVSLENLRLEVELKNKTIYEILAIVAKKLKIEVVYGSDAIVLRRPKNRRN